MVTVSSPPYAKTEASRPMMNPSEPFGRKPPSPVRFEVPGASLPGSTPRMASTPMTRKTTMATTFSVANQNSNSPKFFTAARLVPQKITMKRATQAHSGVPGSQPDMISAAPIPSRPTATQSRNQNAQPEVNPAHGPIARSAWTENEPEAGLAADISPSIRMTSITSRPEAA